MEYSSRHKRLTEVVGRARALAPQAHPATTVNLRVLAAVTPPDIAELGEQGAGEDPAAAVVDRIAAVVGCQPLEVRAMLSDSLLEGPYTGLHSLHACLRRRYEESGESDAAFERTLGQPPNAYPFLLHGLVNTWLPGQASLVGVLIDDDRWTGLCRGFLIAKGRAFSCVLDLLEASAQQAWVGWQEFWGWF